MAAVATATETMTEVRGGTMKALVQEGRGSADVLHVREVPMPQLTDGRVLVRMRAASVNALDWHTTHGGLLLEIAAKIMRSTEQPVRGVDFAGVIEAVGPGVTNFAVGDEVFGGSVATFAEYIRARADRIVRKPSAMSFEEAATLNVAGHTALQALRDHARVQPGQRVLVYGAGGGVGNFAVQIAKALGARVTAVTGTRNVDLVKALGADDVFDYTKVDVTRLTDRYDAVIDVAAIQSVGSLRRVLTPDGVFVQVGAGKKGGWIGIFGRIGAVAFRKTVLKQRVTFFVAQSPASDLEYLVELFESGRLKPAIERTYPLAEAREAVRYVGTGRARAKVVITA